MRTISLLLLWLAYYVSTSFSTPYGNNVRQVQGKPLFQPLLSQQQNFQPQQQYNNNNNNFGSRPQVLSQTANVPVFRQQNSQSPSARIRGYGGSSTGMNFKQIPQATNIKTNNLRKPAPIFIQPVRNSQNYVAPVQSPVRQNQVASVNYQQATRNNVQQLSSVSNQGIRGNQQISGPQYFQSQRLPSNKIQPQLVPVRNDQRFLQNTRTPVSASSLHSNQVVGVGSNISPQTFQVPLNREPQFEQFHSSYSRPGFISVPQFAASGQQQSHVQQPIVAKQIQPKYPTQEPEVREVTPEPAPSETNTRESRPVYPAEEETSPTPTTTPTPTPTPELTSPSTETLPPTEPPTEPTESVPRDLSPEFSQDDPVPQPPQITYPPEIEPEIEPERTGPNYSPQDFLPSQPRPEVVPPEVPSRDIPGYPEEPEPIPGEAETPEVSQPPFDPEKTNPQYPTDEAPDFSQSEDVPQFEVETYEHRKPQIVGHESGVRNTKIPFQRPKFVPQSTKSGYSQSGSSQGFSRQRFPSRQFSRTKFHHEMERLPQRFQHAPSNPRPSAVPVFHHPFVRHFSQDHAEFGQETRESQLTSDDQFEIVELRPTSASSFPAEEFTREDPPPPNYVQRRPVSRPSGLRQQYSKKQLSYPELQEEENYPVSDIESVPSDNVFSSGQPQVQPPIDCENFWNQGMPTPEDPDGDGIRGMAAIDYPTFDVIPRTSFRCEDQDITGIFADVETGCQVYHSCSEDGIKNSFLCPNGTIFNQQHFVCTWWHSVDCSLAPSFYHLNSEIGKSDRHPPRGFSYPAEETGFVQVGSPSQRDEDRDYSPQRPIPVTPSQRLTSSHFPATKKVFFAPPTQASQNKWIISSASSSSSKSEGNGLTRSPSRSPLRAKTASSASRQTTSSSSHTPTSGTKRVASSDPSTTPTH